MGIPYVYDDGGRKAAGFKGHTGDCACRALAIVTGEPYKSVYEALIEAARRERPYGTRKRSHPRTGYHRATYDRHLRTLGFTWTPTATFGSTQRVHMDAAEVPPGRHILRLRRHFVALIDGVIHDTFEPNHTRANCVYGYWTPENE
jgi:hypothetical protein